MTPIFDGALSAIRDAVSGFALEASGSLDSLESGPHAQSATHEARRAVERKFFMGSMYGYGCDGSSVADAVRKTKRKPCRRNFGRQGGGEKDACATPHGVGVKTGCDVGNCSTPSFGFIGDLSSASTEILGAPLARRGSTAPLAVSLVSLQQRMSLQRSDLRGIDASRSASRKIHESPLAACTAHGIIGSLEQCAGEARCAFTSDHSCADRLPSGQSRADIAKRRAPWSAHR